MCYFDSLRNDAADVAAKFFAVHGNKYDYPEGQSMAMTSRISIICHQHGEFKSTVANHINRGGCPECSRISARLSYEEFLSRSRAKHGNRYDYSLVEYAGSEAWVKIICPDHGVFEKTPDNHYHKTRPQGCPRCVQYFGYRSSMPGYLYLISSECGAMMKVGISNNARRRHAQLSKRTPFKLSVTKIIKFEDGGEARRAESEIHAMLKSAGLSGFDGCTEWFLWDDRIFSIMDSKKGP